MAFDDAAGQWENWYPAGKEWGPKVGACDPPPWKGQGSRFKDAAGVTVRVTGTSGSRALALASTRTTDAWKSATVKEGETETVVELKAVMQMKGDEIAGKGPPVEFILTRSSEVQNAMKSIDHTESMKAQ